MVEQLKRIIGLDRNAQICNSLVEKLNGVDVTRKELEVYIQKYQEFLPNEILQELKEIEVSTKAKQKILAANYLLSKVGGEDNTESIQAFSLAWIEFSQVLDSYIQYVPSDLIKTLKQTSEKIILDDFFKNTVNYFMANIYNISKAILSEIEKYNQQQKLNLKKQNSSWDLVIGTRPIKDLLEESKKRIHLLDDLDPKTKEEAQEHLETLEYLEKELKNR